MKPLPKARAGGIIRKSLDNTWRTPPKISDPTRLVYFGGRIPFDAATGLENPMRAERFCAGDFSGEPLEAELAGAILRRDREDAKRVRGEIEALRARTRSLAAGAALGETLRASMAEPTDATRTTAGDPWGLAWLEAVYAMRAGAMPFCSGLEVPWRWPTWVNPPYGRELRRWLEKITTEAKAGAEVVGLLPCARWEQRYFHKVLRAVRPLHVCLITSRVAFVSSIDGEEVGGNPYANMLLGWNTDPGRWLDAYGELGECQEWKRMRRQRPRVAVPLEVAAVSPGPLFDSKGVVCFQ